MSTPASPSPAVNATPAASPANGAKADPSAAGSPTANATPAEIKRMKLKLEGQDVEMSENEVIALAQKGKTSDKRFQEASEMRRQAEEIIKFGRENPTEFFKKTGMNARQWAEEFLMQELKREQMTPEQKKAADNEEKLNQIEKERKADKEAKARAEQDELRKKHAENYDKLFVDALGKCGLPRTPFTVKRMAELQLVNIQNKLDLNADQLAKVVREDYMAEQKSLFGAFEGDQLLEFLGPELAKKLSKAQIAKLKGKGLQTKSASVKTNQNPDGSEMTWRDYQKRNRGRV